MAAVSAEAQPTSSAHRTPHSQSPTSTTADYTHISVQLHARLLPTNAATRITVLLQRSAGGVLRHLVVAFLRHHSSPSTARPPSNNQFSLVIPSPSLPSTASTASPVAMDSLAEGAHAATRSDSKDEKRTPDPSARIA